MKENIQNIISQGDIKEYQSQELLKAQKILSNLQKIPDYSVT
jgi:hypothetical protein